MRKIFLLFAFALVACTENSLLPDPEPSITLTPDSVSVAVGQTATLTAVTQNAVGAPEYVSRNISVANVSANGTITGVAAGKTVVVGSLVAQGVRDSVVVVVTGGGGSGSPVQLPLLGTGAVPERYTAEVAAAGNVAYTTTWNFRQAPGNSLKIWNVAGNTPVLTDSIIVSGAGTLSDVQISDDGGLLVVSIEGGSPSTSNGIVIYNRSNATRPTQISRYNSPNTSAGVHTVKLSRINGRHYAFLNIDPPSRLTILDITNPAAPVEVFSQLMGNPYIHDVFVRDGILMAALWDDGMRIFDVGGGGRGGSPSAPVVMGTVAINNAHNIWWFHNPNGEKKYAFVGEEVPGNLGGFQNSAGDVHVIDVSDLSQPRKVAFYRPDPATTSTGQQAGAHNFVLDEPSGILYAAFYNGGVRALDVRGDLSVCTAAQTSAQGFCDLRLMGREAGIGVSSGGTKYVWGVAMVGNNLYASDMPNGLHKLDISALKR